MRKFILTTLIVSSISIFAQPNKGKGMKMAPVLAPGYYVPMKGDTVRGEIQTNLENDASYYKSFFFKAANSPKTVEMTAKKAKAYGFGDQEFITLKIDEEDVYIKYLENGRLRLMEYQYVKVIDGVEKYPSVYYIQDTKAASDDKNNTKELTQLPERKYKPVLAKFFKDQPILLEEVDKWYFKIDEIRKAVREFNKLYTE